ncbi:MAG TPA: hypothetical protein VMV20_00850 [Chitinophagaceae bacterium]|nr:hypothetical protein [Chitinophagaceae bacterium]
MLKSSGLFRKAFPIPASGQRDFDINTGMKGEHPLTDTRISRLPYLPGIRFTDLGGISICFGPGKKNRPGWRLWPPGGLKLNQPVCIIFAQYRSEMIK